MDTICSKIHIMLKLNPRNRQAKTFERMNMEYESEGNQWQSDKFD